MRLPRVMLTAPASGSGKTLITCGILQALVNRNLRAASFKCGPDYIDPMFHRTVIGTPSRNLDTFFTDEATTRYLFARQAAGMDISVMEGVMGYYDGVAGVTDQASSYDLARVTGTPAVLIVNARGMSLSAAALIRGFSEYRPDSRIRGVILNRIGLSAYAQLKPLIERETGLAVLGYVPEVRECVIESRHLGLVTPDGIADLRERLSRLAKRLEETLDIDGLIRLAGSAPELDGACPEDVRKLQTARKAGQTVRIGVARDEAFCFYYEDNLELLRELGAELTEFSPLHDRELPAGICGILFGGGYPELYAEELSENTRMLAAVRAAVGQGIPYLAECGGFMYLHRTMEDMQGKAWPMAGVLPGRAYRTERLGRFGYVTLRANKDQVFGAAGCRIRGHEFHYFDSSDCGDAFRAEKPGRKKSWDCMTADGHSAAGFPHLYYYANPQFAANFVDVCAGYARSEKEKRENSL